MGKMNVGLPIWMLLVALLAGVAVAGFLYFRNRKQHYGKALTIILFALRTLMTALAVLLLFNPYIRQKVTSVEQSVLVLAHDNSASIALGKDSAYFKTEYLSQLEQFKSELADAYQVDSYEFGQEIRDFDQLDFSDQLTDISNLLQTLDRRYYKRNVGAVVLFSDGVYNRGFEPELLAQKFPFPIHAVVLGDTVSYPDLSIKNVHYNKVVSLGATYPVRVTVGARDLANKKVTITLSEDGRLIDKQEITIPSNRFSKEIDFMLEATSKGVKQIDIEVSGLENEEQMLNNVKHIFVEVLDQKYKVLCLANAPHPDLSAIRSVLNENYEVDFAFAKEQIPDFANYNLVVLHQVPSEKTDFNALKLQLEKNRKMPLLFVVGPSSDLKYLNEIQKVYAINIGATNTVLDVKAHGNASFSTFTMESKDLEIVNRFPPLALPHTEITPLAAHDDLLLQDVMGVKSGLPLLSYAQDGRKMAFLFGTNVWRWRLFEYYESENHAVFDEIFTKSLKYLLLAADDGSAIYCKEEYYSNEPIIIRAELRNASNELITDPDVNIQIVNKLTGDTYDYAFAKREHDYELNAGILPEGIYTYKVQSQIGDKILTVNGSFSVVAIGIEAQQLTADWERMCYLAASTNGKCYMADDMQQLLADLQNDTRITSVEHQETRFEDLIHSKWLFFVLIGLAAVEWVLRKMFGSY